MKKSIPIRVRFAAVSAMRMASVLALVLVFLAIVDTEASTPPAGLAEASQSALKKFLPALDSPTMKQQHGFAPDDDFSAVTLGTPFEPQYLLAEGIEKYVSGMKVESVLIPSHHWFFPVNSRGRQACLLSVIHRRDGTFLEDKLGMAQLARVWASVNDAWPGAKNYTPLLVIVPTHQRFYFTVPQADGPNLTRISIEQADTAKLEIFQKLTSADKEMDDLRQRGSASR